MIETADIVAAKYGVSREDQDAYAVECQARTAAAQAAGKRRGTPRERRWGKASDSPIFLLLFSV